MNKEIELRILEENVKITLRDIKEVLSFSVEDPFTGGKVSFNEFWSIERKLWSDDFRSAARHSAISHSMLSELRGRFNLIEQKAENIIHQFNLFEQKIKKEVNKHD